MPARRHQPRRGARSRRWCRTARLARRLARHPQGDPGRRRHGRRQRRRRGRARRRRRAVRPRPRRARRSWTSAPSSAATSRSRSTAVPRSAATAAPSSRPRWCAARSTGCSRSPRRPVDAGGLPRADRLRDGPAAVPDPEVPAGAHVGAARGRPRRPRPALRNDLQTAALSLRPLLAQVLEIGEEYGALGGVVSGSGPDLRVPRARRRARARPRRRVHGVRRLPHGAARASARCRARGSSTSGSRADAAAHLVALEDVGKSLGTRTLLDGVTARRHRGRPDRRRRPQRRRQDHARLACSTGLEDADSGRVIRRRRRSRSACSRRATTSTRRPPCATSSSATAPSTSGPATPRVRDVIGGLLGGVDADAYADGLDAVVGTMSGGERRRAALAAAAHRRPRPAGARRADQPPRRRGRRRGSPHHLAPRRGALVVVTHDRWFLDEVCHRDVGGRRRRGAPVRRRLRGVRPRAGRAVRRQAASTEERRQNLLRKELAWLRRGPPARTSKPKFRIDAANALIADEPPPRDTPGAGEVRDRAARQAGVRPRGRHGRARRRARRRS